MNDRPMTRSRLDEESLSFRKKILEIIKCARRGHIGSAFSIVEILRVLYDRILRYKPEKPGWIERDRFILSKGHGCLALYVMLAQKEFFPEKELSCFCKAESILGGHPEFGKVPGIEASTGSLGHGLSIGVGFALNGRIDRKDYGTFILLGDGECNEGSVWEAAMSASKHKLERLTAIVDYNKMQSYSSTYEVQDLEPFADKWSSFGFTVEEVDGHDVKALNEVFMRLPLRKDHPSAIICHTTKGRGIASIEGNANWHHKSKVTDEELERLLRELDESSL